MKTKTIIAIGAVSALGFLGFMILRSKRGFSSSIEPIPSWMRDQMRGVSWHAECPVSLDDLVLLKVRHWTPSGTVAQGELIINKNNALQIANVFRNLYAQKFPVERMDRIVKYNGDDPTSMAANNTAGFRCSTRERTKFHERGTWSEHAHGQGIDINPLYNPYVKGERIEPPGGAPYADRSVTHAQMVTPSVVQAFAQEGWKWGGDWRSAKDYQHFSVGGR